MHEVAPMHVARLWLGSILILAGVLKLWRPASARKYIEKRIKVSKMVARAAVTLLGAVEIALGLSLVIGKGLDATVGATAVLLVGFSIWLALDSTGREAEACGCFGPVGQRGASREVDIARNVLLLAVTGFLGANLDSANAVGPVKDPLAIVFSLVLVPISALVYGMMGRLFSMRTTQIGRVQASGPK